MSFIAQAKDVRCGKIHQTNRANGDEQIWIDLAGFGSVTMGETLSLNALSPNNVITDGNCVCLVADQFKTESNGYQTAIQVTLVQGQPKRLCDELGFQ